jgi:hypothetical protein
LRSFASGHVFAFFVGVRDERIHSLAKFARQLASHSSSELARKIGVRSFVFREFTVPTRLELAPSASRIPRLIHFGGNFEGRMLPADVRTSRLDLLCAQRFSMRLVAARLVGGAHSDNRLEANQ